MELSLWGYVTIVTLTPIRTTAGDPPQWCEQLKGDIQISKGDIQTYFFQY